MKSEKDAGRGIGAPASFRLERESGGKACLLTSRDYRSRIFPSMEIVTT